MDDDRYDELRGDSYGIERDKLPTPDVTIKPQAGDLVLFKPRNLHAVCSTSGKYRIGISTFVMYGGESKSLKLWS